MTPQGLYRQAAHSCGSHGRGGTAVGCRWWRRRGSGGTCVGARISTKSLPAVSGLYGVDVPSRLVVACTTLRSKYTNKSFKF